MKNKDTAQNVSVNFQEYLRCQAIALTQAAADAEAFRLAALATASRLDERRRALARAGELIGAQTT